MHSDSKDCKCQTCTITRHGTRPFPIQGGDTARDEQGKQIYSSPSTIPWWLAEIAYEQYSALHGTQQSLEHLAARGGFGRYELVRLLRREKH